MNGTDLLLLAGGAFGALALSMFGLTLVALLAAMFVLAVGITVHTTRKDNA